MLRTAMPTVGARGAIRFFAPSRTGLRIQSLPHLRTAHTSTQRTLTQRSTVARKPPTTFTFSSHPRPLPTTFLQRLRLSIRFFNSSRLRLNGKPTSPNPTPSLNAGAESKPNTLGARMRKLSREYGWSALGVYLALTAIDFPFCYMLVRYLGAEKIGKFQSPLCVVRFKIVSRLEGSGSHEHQKSVHGSVLRVEAL
jgi:N-terminal acetyltransferase 2